MGEPEQSATMRMADGLYELQESVFDITVAECLTYQSMLSGRAVMKR